MHLRIQPPCPLDVLRMVPEGHLPEKVTESIDLRLGIDWLKDET